MPTMPVIDIHSHFFPESWPDLAEKFGTPNWPWMRHEGDGKAMVMLGEKEFRPVYDACWDTKRRLEEMDRDGIDLQVICATLILFAYNRADGFDEALRSNLLGGNAKGVLGL